MCMLYLYYTLCNPSPRLRPIIDGRTAASHRPSGGSACKSPSAELYVYGTKPCRIVSSVQNPANMGRDSLFFSTQVRAHLTLAELTRRRSSLYAFLH